MILIVVEVVVVGLFVLFCLLLFLFPYFFLKSMISYESKN